MRKQFNSSLLPSEPPRKLKSKNTRKANNKKSPYIKALFEDLIDQTDGKYDDFALARACYLHYNTVKNWKYGRPPGRISHVQIAKYFAPLVHRHYKLILQDIEEAYYKHMEQE